MKKSHTCIRRVQHWVFLQCLKTWPCPNSKLLVLDGVSDPGNLGTILRLADWFGIFHVVCSSTSVSCYNPRPKPVWASRHACNVCTHHYPNFWPTSSFLFTQQYWEVIRYMKNTCLPCNFNGQWSPWDFSKGPVLCPASNTHSFCGVGASRKLKCCYGHSHSTVWISS